MSVRFFTSKQLLGRFSGNSHRRADPVPTSHQLMGTPSKACDRNCFPKSTPATPRVKRKPVTVLNPIAKRGRNGRFHDGRVSSRVLSTSNEPDSVLRTRSSSSGFEPSSFDRSEEPTGASQPYHSTSNHDGRHPTNSAAPTNQQETGESEPSTSSYFISLQVLDSHHRSRLQR